MQLSKQNLRLITSGVKQPEESLFMLPEKVMQFGTGVLLRGLCDYIIHTANEKGIFQGRIVVVKSTEGNDANVFHDQDNLYTVCARGIHEGTDVKQNIICAAISRVLSARKEWDLVLEAVHQPELRIIISNTTEIGIQYSEELMTGDPPSSFPAKLLAVLFRRFSHFHGNTDSGMIIVPTELIPDNGKKLREFIHRLAVFNQLDDAFLRWLDERVYFCDSLVDRIVTRNPGKNIITHLQHDLSYDDKLITICEDYRLWAITGPQELLPVLSFVQANTGAILSDDIAIFKCLKLHLLNGTHTICAPLAILSGFETVKQAMEDKVFYHYAQEVMLHELAAALPLSIPADQSKQFCMKVLDRFRNPYVEHQLIDITFQQSAKMRMRIIPVLLKYLQTKNSVPKSIVKGFAAYLLFMKPVAKDRNHFYGYACHKKYMIADEHASFFNNLWKNEDGIMTVVIGALQNKEIWGVDLSRFSDFKKAVHKVLYSMIYKIPD